MRYLLVFSLAGLFLSTACEPKEDTDNSNTDPTPTPVACGGWLGDTCGSGEFCLFEQEASCGWADAPGVCEQLPQACISLYAPVCACDGETYSNECVAHAAGTAVLHDIDAANVDDIEGDWSGLAPAGWVTQWQFKADGTFIKTDLISPCPADVACVWSGIVTNSGSWSLSFGAVSLSYTSRDNMAGATTPPTLSAEGSCGGFILVEAGPGGQGTYKLD